MKCQECCQKLQNLFSKYSWIVPTLCRLTLGIVFLQSGWGKLHNLEHVTQFFGDLGIPFPQLQAPFVATCELLSGIFLLTGIFSRLGAFLIQCIMLVAIITAKMSDVHSFSDFIGLQEWDYLIMAAVVKFYGAGPLSLGCCCKNWCSKWCCKNQAPN